MPIDPTIGYNPGTIQGLVTKDADFDRRLRALEASRTVIGDGAISGAKLGQGSVSANHIQANSISAGMIQAGAVIASHIQAGAIEALHISANAIQAGHISAGSIQAGHLSANSVVAGTIAAGAVTAGTIAAGAVTATEIAVSSLSSITSDLGAITAGTITGATFQTAAGGARVVMNSGGLHGYGLDGVTKVFGIDTGSGIASFTGVATLNPASVVPGPALSAAILGGGNRFTNSSFEQGTRPGETTDRRAEGFQNSSGTGAGYGPTTEQTYHGPNAYKLVRTSAAGMWLGRRDIAADRIPVQAGKKYTFSFWARPGTRIEALRAYIYWFTDNTTAGISGAHYLGQDTGVNVIGSPANDFATCPVNEWTRVTFTATAPATAKYAGMIAHASAASQAAGDVVYLDAYQFEEGDVPTAYSPKSDEILYSQISALNIAAGSITANHIQAGAITAESIGVQFGGKNMLWNSSFEDPLDSTRMWVVSIGSGTLTATGTEIVPVDGKKVLKLTTTAGASTVHVGSSQVQATPHAAYSGAYKGTTDYPGFYPLIPGKKYSFSYFVASPTVSRQFRARLTWFDGLMRQFLPAPTGVTATPGTGGSLTAGTNTYAVNAVNSQGETNAASTVNATVAANGKVTIVATLPADDDNTPYPVTAVRLNRLNGSQWQYVDFPANGGTTVNLVDDGALTWTNRATNPVSIANTALTVEVTLTDSADIASQVAVANPGVASMTSPTLLTSPLLTTGVQGTSKYIQWMRPAVTADAALGARFARPIARIGTVASGEVHYFDAFQLEPGDVSAGFAPRGDEVLPGSVGNTQITPNSITTNEIMAAGIQADRLSVSTLSAVSANAGTITAGTITGVTITGGLIRTKASGARIELDQTSMRFIDSSNGVGLTVSDGYITTDTNPNNSRFQLNAAGVTAYYGSERTYEITNWGNQHFYRGSNGFPGLYFFATQSGPQVGSIFQADWGGTINKTSIRSLTDAIGHPTSQVDIVAHHHEWAGVGDNRVSQLGVEHTTSGTGGIFARSNGHYVNVLNSAGASTFVQLGGRNRWTDRYGMWQIIASAGWSIPNHATATVTWDYGAGNVNFGDNPSGYLIDGYRVNIGYMEYVGLSYSHMSGSTFQLHAGFSYGPDTGGPTATGAIGVQLQGAGWV